MVTAAAVRSVPSTTKYAEWSHCRPSEAVTLHTVSWVNVHGCTTTDPAGQAEHTPHTVLDVLEQFCMRYDTGGTQDWQAAHWVSKYCEQLETI
jgi:hypothetical protein